MGNRLPRTLTVRPTLDGRERRLGSLAMFAAIRRALAGCTQGAVQSIEKGAHQTPRLRFGKKCNPNNFVGALARQPATKKVGFPLGFLLLICLRNCLRNSLNYPKGLGFWGLFANLMGVLSENSIRPGLA
jgi:hypothetical protein